MELKLEDLVVGEIYYENYNNLNGNKYIFEYCKNQNGKGYKHHINTSTNNYSNNTKHPSQNGFQMEGVRHATAKEKAWLNACIKANKFIPLSEIKEEPIDILSKLELW